MQIALWSAPHGEPEQGTRPREAPRRTFLLIQVLRGVAAVMVVCHHTTQMQNARLSGAREPWLAGAAGVDLFFVISGFVMALSSNSLRGTLRPARTFLRRRLERVVPLYWIATTLKLAVAVRYAPELLNGTWHIVASYLFLPALNEAGALHPVLIVGWTLNFEMFFYAVVAAGLGFRLPLLPYLTVSLMLLGGFGALRSSGHTSYGWAALGAIDPMLFEFLFGVLLAAVLPLLKARLAWQKGLCVLLAFCAFALIVTHGETVSRPDRPLVWGLSAAVIVGCALALEEDLGRRMPAWLLEIGNASYSNYLTHTLLLAGVGAVLARSSALHKLDWDVEASVLIFLCILAAEAVYRGVERPIVRFFEQQRTRGPA